MIFTLKQARRYANQTQRDMAEKLGISRDANMRLEKNPDKVTVRQAKIISQITGIPYDSIFFAS